MSPACNLQRLEILRDRAHMLKRARSFFEERGVIEVDCPIISHAGSVDTHIDLITASSQGKPLFLHSSPEYGMKRLLSEGIGDIYQLSHVFRDGEVGSRHNPEFMMAEWYRVGYAFNQLIDETCDFIRLFVGDVPQHEISYRDSFIQAINIDPFTASEDDLRRFLQQKDDPVDFDTKDDLLTYIVSTYIEGSFDPNILTVFPYFPPTQAMLAQVAVQDGFKVAERFEVFYRGLELANGYHELANPDEQRARLLEANKGRKALGKPTLPIDENFLAALKNGLPDSCGVAVGFDRLMMVRHQASSIKKVIPFSWEVA